MRHARRGFGGTLTAICQLSKTCTGFHLTETALQFRVDRQPVAWESFMSRLLITVYMARKGVELSLETLIIVVLLVAVIAIVGGVTIERFIDVGEDNKDTANSSSLRWCEEQVENHCNLNPEGDWGSVYESCTKYSDIIGNGEDTSCNNVGN